MKKIFTLFTILIIAASANAQTQKGNQLLGGSFSISGGSGSTTEFGTAGAGDVTSHNKLSSFGIGPAYSYFIADNLDLGVSGGYVRQKETDTYPNVGTHDSKATGYNYGAYLRKYFLFENKVGLRAGPFANYQSTKDVVDFANNIANPEENKHGVFRAGLGFDFVYFPTSRLGLAANLGTLEYTRDHYTMSESNALVEESKDHTFGFNLASSNLALSVFYSFGK